MFSLTNPYVLMSVISLVISSYFYGHHQAYVEQALEIARLSAIAQTQKEESDNALRKEKQNAKAKIDNLQSAIASGEQRLFISTTQVCGAAAASGDGQARAELDRSTAQALVAITGDGDQAIIELNNCIDRYNNLRKIK